ncbi:MULTISPECIES: tripartite tricarboxylate transporter TctB family protein [unclassified Corynebacterium]|uniref:tripartite tricarboxylate transporter TctB family protein n=1 Tax=Corynebacterium TaxID=1716 RepID=UPI00254A194F|nr:MULTISPECIES: tripartite tricarboxylate transporter TctB family protein [unclassified Corynebacterium]MDK8453198.1 tripartite tricarboxylate transporter TctB family protein [Corynebacterium sp. MSK084]MDK8467838.1 tripartite tricarboxylate transporter TctB family protein [Corynebacterium sp. MSK130]MDK8476860.1 tripartite tricarboxylate transporter TctB family protein [Corynebacterium sp. MSK310]MDK8492236.1 tripartite tricarboxylate transporter TctB family protein [Corynebacterium sp. MSK17
MADEKQLTVAELLARNKKDRTDKDEKTSRRRRRSLDEGGVSVAELTGSLKKVKSTPPEAKHTNVSIDDDAPVIRAPKSKDEQAAEKNATAKPTSSKPAGSTPAGAKPAGAKSTAGKSAAGNPAAGQAGIGKPAQSRPSQPKSASPKPAAEKPSAGTPTASPAPKKNGKPSGPTASPKPAAGPASQPTAKPAPAQKANAQEGKKPAQSEPEDKASAKDAEKKSHQPSADDTAVMQRIGKSQSLQDKRKDAADAAESSAKETAGAAGAAGTGAAAATAAGAKDAGTKGKAAAPAQKPVAAAKKPDDTGELSQVRDEEVTEEHEKLNPMSILIMVVVGIVLAIVIFKGFEVLWDNFPRIVVAILALGVTAIMVGVTHALRTARDGFSMFLAGLTGLILTFGPLLLVML